MFTIIEIQTMELSGTVLTGEQMEPVEGTVVLDGDKIENIREEPVVSDDIILPALINAHTHIGDSIAKEAGRGLSVQEVVEPPDGLKHQLIDNASKSESRESMHNTAQYMAQSGIGLFADFRENGVEGVADLHAAVGSVPIEPFVLGRGPPEVVSVADGYGGSVVHHRDFGPARDAAHKTRKPFGIHAGERDTNDIDGALSLDPDFLVHMVHARAEDFQTLADRRIPVVVCPRSNLVTGAGRPPIGKLTDATTVALGTDNVMLNSPSMWREMEFTSKLYDISDTEVLQMATVNGATLIGRSDVGTVEEGKKARLVVLSTDGKLDGIDDPVAGVVRRAGSVDVSRVVFDGEFLDDGLDK